LDRSNLANDKFPFDYCEPKRSDDDKLRIQGIATKTGVADLAVRDDDEHSSRVRQEVMKNMKNQEIIQATKLRVRITFLRYI
jgi:hypothetical protein